MPPTAYGRLGGWLVPGLAVVALLVGVSWWFAEAPPPSPPRSAPVGAEEPAAPDPIADEQHALLQAVGQRLSVMDRNLLYELTIANPGDGHTYLVPASTDPGLRLRMLCLPDGELLVTLPSGAGPVVVPCGEAYSAPIASSGSGAVVTVRRAGSTTAAYALRVAADG